MADNRQQDAARQGAETARQGADAARDNARQGADTTRDIARQGAEAAGTSARATSDAIRRGGEVAADTTSRTGQAGADALQRSGQAAAETMRRGTQQLADSQQQIVQNAAEQFEELTRRVLEAIQGTSEDVRSLISVPGSARGGLQDLQQGVTGIVEGVIRTNLQAVQELFRLMNPSGYVELQQRFAREHLDTLVQNSVTLIRAVRRTADETLGPLEQQLEQRRRAREQEGGEGQR
jgi:hypothetical protein